MNCHFFFSEFRTVIGHGGPAGPEASDMPRTEQFPGFGKHGVRDGLCGHKLKMEKQLLAAAKEGRDAEVIQLLKDGASVNCHAWSGETPLHSAARNGHNSIAEMLLARGADVHCVEMDGYTPLRLAAFCGHKDTAKLLIAHGADIHCRDLFGFTPLDVAQNDSLRAAMQQQHAARQAEHWSRRAPLAFGPRVEPVLMTTLLCAKQCGLQLPIELWQHVFSHLQRQDFLVLR
eukprot:m.232200 g.232200  ORF g.232200 m.232200 type:complete len:231 (+) comp10875_c0_seq49:480-1172(+)